MNTISGRRLAGFLVLTLAIVVGTLTFGLLFGDTEKPAGPTSAPSVEMTPQASAPVSAAPAGAASPSAPAAPTATPTARATPGPTRRPVAAPSDVPPAGGTIPPIVPIPSGPVP